MLVGILLLACVQLKIAGDNCNDPVVLCPPIQRHTGLTCVCVCVLPVVPDTALAGNPAEEDGMDAVY